MKRVKLTVAYDGTNYSGWQIQPNGVTVEEVLQTHLSELLDEPVKLIGASRTDTGVHALGNVAVFDTSARIPAEKISYALNTRLPEDIRIQESKEVPADFHPRFCKTIKTYEYRILNRRFPDPTRRLYTLFYYCPLDLEKMQKGLSYLVGEHDFKSYCTHKEEVENTVRTLYEASAQKEGDLLTLRFRGNGFLYHMVRIITGTALRVGSGYYPPEYMKELLEKRDRGAAGETAPARGLCLIGITYPGDGIQPPQNGSSASYGQA